MKLDVSAKYLHARASEMRTPVTIDCLAIQIEPAALAETRSLNLVRMCHEFLRGESERLGEHLSIATVQMRLEPPAEPRYDVMLGFSDRMPRFAASLRRSGPLKYQWLEWRVIDNHRLSIGRQ
jgi:hypothetical protein